MDIFGFKTQGINYDKFRPRYPLAFIQTCLASIKHKNRYLDIATGTGQLLYAFAPYFQYNKGIDISKNMIDNAIKASQSFTLNQKQIQFQVNDVMNFDESQKYDFITVGQALHFFPQNSLNKIKNLLAPHGVFTTFGYIAKQMISKNQKQDEYYNQFYSKVKPHFTFDRDDLHTFYQDQSKYPFEKIFSKVERSKQQVPLVMNKQEYLSYLRTMSGYNLYLQKFQDDPLLDLSKVCADQVTIIMYYFQISCYID